MFSKMTLRNWLELIALSILWGGSFLFGRIAAGELPAFAIAFGRVAIAAIVLWVFVFVSGRNFRQLAPITIPLLALGLFNNAIPFSLILWGQKEVGAGLASVLNAMTPVWTLLLAAAVTVDEKITSTKVFGVAAGISGVVLLFWDSLDGGGGQSPLSRIAILCAGASYAIAAIFGRRFKTIDPVLVATGQLTGSSLLLFFPALMAGGIVATPSPAAIASVLALALACTALAYVLFFRILASAGATNLSLVTFLIPVSALLMGALFLGESLSLLEAGGMALIALALAAIDGRLLRNPFRTR
jgi:drug/metabolite transporter (DMT)-like permease